MKKGFTLVELSIVLVIIALIIGGVLVGQDMVKNAELNGMITDTQKLSSAYERFKAQYNKLPGDMPNAFDYFSTNCADVAGNCNGDGDGKIVKTESYQAWKHLQAAKMINYSIAVLSSSSSSANCQTGTNIPALKMDTSTAMFTCAYASDVSCAETDAFTATVTNPGQLIMVGLASGTQTTCATSGVMTSEQIYTIDKKIDDGLAYKGKYMTGEGTTGCTTSTTSSDDGNYSLSASGQNLCKLYVVLKQD